jgi:Rieske 2Fe-2S family protein
MREFGMNAHFRSKISELIQVRKPGYTLPAELYTSEAAFEVDLEIFFRSHWIVAAVEADIPEAGDVRAVDIGKTSILILRDDDMVVRAFHNVCRHRGARLVQEEKTSVGRLVCPYHQWSYELNGDLVHASQMGQEFDKSCFSLRSVHVKLVGGIIMVCIAEQAPVDIDELVATMDARLVNLHLTEARIAHETTIIEEGNWKLSVDNNRECYHCSTSHPELCRSINGLDIGFDPEELSEEEIAEWEAHQQENKAASAVWENAGFPSALVEDMNNRPTIYRTQRFSIADAGESHTMDTKAACRKLLGTMTDRRMGDLHFWTHNSWHHFFADHAVISYLVPLSPGRTALRTVWLVHPDAREGEDYDLQRLTEVWEATNRQDAELVALAQKGVETTGYQPGPLSVHVERLVDLNIGWYVERLKAHGY